MSIEDLGPLGASIRGEAADLRSLEELEQLAVDFVADGSAIVCSSLTRKDDDAAATFITQEIDKDRSGSSFPSFCIGDTDEGNVFYGFGYDYNNQVIPLDLDYDVDMVQAVEKIDILMSGIELTSDERRFINFIGTLLKMELGLTDVAEQRRFIDRNKGNAVPAADLLRKIVIENATTITQVKQSNQPFGTDGDEVVWVISQDMLKGDYMDWGDELAKIQVGYRCDARLLEYHYVNLAESGRKLDVTYLGSEQEVNDSDWDGEISTEQTEMIEDFCRDVCPLQPDKAGVELLTSKVIEATVSKFIADVNL